MIIRGLRVEHWRCIGKLELADLPAGIVVLHGPNRTGKSSLVRALRCCLYDFDHNTVSKEFKKNIPWGGHHSPRVAVEFETGGQCYRLTKVFSTRMDGDATLEKKSAGRWHREDLSAKEASRKTLELLGLDKPDSTAGLNQLLWLDQGTVELPDPKDLDGALENRLLKVLGVLVTGRDQAFREALEGRWGRWFTPTGEYRKNSEVSRLGNLRTERQALLEREEEKFREIEQVIRQLQDGEDERPRRQQEMEAARRELERLRAEQEQGRQRQQQHRDAEQACGVAAQRCALAEAHLQAYREADQRCRESEHKVVQAEAAVQALQAEKDRLALEHAARSTELESARQGEEAQQRGREEIEDRRKLLTLAQQRSQFAQALDRVLGLEREATGLEQKLQSVPAPERQTLDELQQNRRQARELQAQLRAAALTLAVQPTRYAQLRLSIDGQPAQVVDLPAQDRRSWSLRQRAEIELPGWGMLTLARGQEDQDLERCAQELAGLDRDYRELVQAYHEDPADEACLDRLSVRRVEREEWSKRLERLRKELRHLAPQGRGVLESELAERDHKRQVVLRRRPDLEKWSPDAGEVERLAQAFEARLADLQAARKKKEGGEVSARQAAQQAEDQLSRGKEHLAAVRATARFARAELGRLGEETTLRAEQEQAEKAREQARQRLAETHLTEAEQTVDQRCAEAETALQQREGRLREQEDDLNRLRGRLEGSEGLHIRRADAAVALREAEQLLARETLEADAHKHLRELFEKCREGQVQRVTGPISGRVLEWARHLGLDDYREVRFGDRFLPEGIVREGGAPDAPVRLGEESYGTGEQLGLLVRLALGGVLARDEPQVVILDDPLAHADPMKHRRVLDVLKMAAEGSAAQDPPAGCLQVFILTCHPERFDYLAGAHHINLGQVIGRAN